MRGLFVNGVVNQDHGRTDYGYFTEEAVYSGDINELETLVENDKAYTVKVFEGTNSFQIKLESENRKVIAETEGKIEKKGKALKESVHQSTEEPVMPGEYENPHKAIETYAEYALEHQIGDGIKVDGYDLDNLLDDENQNF